MSECRGPYRDMTCGAPFCPHDPNFEPPEGTSWDEHCTACRDRAEWTAEIGADCAREET